MGQARCRNKANKSKSPVPFAFAHPPWNYPRLPCVARPWPDISASRKRLVLMVQPTHVLYSVPSRKAEISGSQQLRSTDKEISAVKSYFSEFFNPKQENSQHKQITQHTHNAQLTYFCPSPSQQHQLSPTRPSIPPNRSPPLSPRNPY